MFGTLNRFLSRLDADSNQDRGSGHAAFGFQVLRNTNLELAIEPWFDFIVGINGRQIDNPSPHLFATEVRNCAGSSVSLGLWSAKGQRIRELSIPIPPASPTLGLTLQWNPLSSTEDVWHILDVAPNSPADTAGLLPYGDYIIGSPEGVVKGEAGLGELVEDHLNRPLRLHVYNHEYNVTRLVTITPTRSWGGQGSLGCVLGFGALHRLPAPLTEPPHAPGETMFETARFSNEEDRAPSYAPQAPVAGAEPLQESAESGGNLLVPATLDYGGKSAGTGRGTSPAKGRKSRHVVHTVGSPNSAIDEYFREGEQKSKELDHAPSPKPGANAAPPPPKKGEGPPKATSPAAE